MSVTFYDFTQENHPETQRENDLYAFMDDVEERLEELFGMTFAIIERIPVRKRK